MEVQSCILGHTVSTMVKHFSPAHSKCQALGWRYCKAEGISCLRNTYRAAAETDSECVSLIKRDAFVRTEYRWEYLT